MRKVYLIAITAIFLNSTVMGQQKKSTGYGLFHPTPRAELREMETDRPDVTESPITLDAGHFQYEGDLFRLEREKSESALRSTYLVNQANLKLGLTSSTAVQLVVQSFAYQKTKSLVDGSVAYAQGFGDLTLRIKQNLIGNDKGRFAVALLPFVIFPTSGVEKQKRYQGGLILPMSFEFPKGWKLGMQLEADRLIDTEGSGLYTQFLESLTIGHQVLKHVDGIAETYYTYDCSQHHWSNFINAALQVELAKDVKLDGGLNYGLQHDAMKSYFLGLSFRL